MDPIRLNKYLVDRGVASRRGADKLIDSGKVTVNGALATLGMKVTDHDAVVVDGKAIDAKEPEKVYIAYYKPIGIICTSDPNAHDNIIDAVGYPERLFHIGRLDVASSGLILLTNDGDIVNRILRAEEKHDKEYVVTVDEKITTSFLYDMAHGVIIDDEDDRPTLPADVVQVDDRTFRIILVEGRNRQIRRMCETLGYNVKALKRVRIMHIELGKLNVGEWRHLTKAEEKELLKLTRSNKKV